MQWIIIAILLLIIIRLWPKALFIIIGSVLVLGAGIFAWTRHQDNERAQIQAQVLYAPAACPAGKPMSVTFTNNAREVLERITFSINARMPGYSSTVTPYTYKQYASDKILQPGETFSACYAEPVMAKKSNGVSLEPEKLEWSATVDNVYFSNN